ncbi:MAG: type II secretion system F family protein [Acidimicrobiales bacterium]
MTAALLLGLVFGFAAFATWRLLFPPTPPLSAAIARLQRRNELTRITSAGEEHDVSDLVGRTLGASLGRMMTGLGLRLDRLEPDLRLLNRTLEQHLGQKVLLAFFGLALPQLVVLAMYLAGTPVGLPIPMVVSLGLALVFFFVPDLTLRSEANARRDAFRHALGSFLDLVVISLAGGAGVESALRDAAAIGRGWAFAQLRQALDVATLTGETPWAALTRLGDELGVSELAELSASVSLAGTEGARVRDSLAVKATSLRDHALAQAESEAQASTEAMALPVVLLFVGFLILIGYPAVDAILGQF